MPNDGGDGLKSMDSGGGNFGFSAGEIVPFKHEGLDHTRVAGSQGWGGLRGRSWWKRLSVENNAVRARDRVCPGVLLVFDMSEDTPSITSGRRDTAEAAKGRSDISL